MKTKLLHLLLALLLLRFTAHATGNTLYLQKLDKINVQFSKALINRDAAKLLKFYAADAIMMPEFHNTIYGKQAIGSYYRQWLDSARVSNYQRNIYSVQRIANYLVELGNITNTFTKTGAAPYVYEAKYIHIWKIDKNGGLQLESEITGSIKAIDRSQLPLSVYVAPDTTQLPRPKLTPALQANYRVNAQVVQFIIKGDGASFAPMYTDDAIYMPYYRPMQIGKSAIKAYYVEHESPSTGINEVHINAVRVINLGQYVLVDGYYIVHWHAGNSQGVVTGKNVNVWKRDTQGKLLLYRQMTVHD